MSSRFSFDKRWRQVKEISSSYRTVIFLLCGGLLMGVAPVNAWPLAWVALVPLWRVAERTEQPMRTAVGYAAIWGFAYHGTALSWVLGIHPMMWMGVPWIGSVAIALFGWAFITLWGAAIGMLWVTLMIAIGRWQPMTGKLRILVGTALWCAEEWVWSQGSFYWSSLSYTQSPYNLLGLHLGQLAGPLVVTAGVVAVNGAIAAALEQEKGKKDYFGRLNRRTMNGAIALFVALHLLGLGLYSRPLINEVGESLAVGLIQGSVPTDHKLTTAGIRESRQIYRSGYESLVAEGAEIVITPEGAIPETWNAFLQDRDPLVRAVGKAGVPLVLGTFVPPVIDQRTGALTQSLLVIDATEEVTGRYNKVKLVPLGEYLPFEKVLDALQVGQLSPFAYSLVPGAFDQQLQTPFGPVVAGICYESAFADLFRQQAGRGGQLILTASNNDPYSRRMMMQHHAQDVMRAVETDRWAVRVTNTGISGVVDPKGRSRWLSEPNVYVEHLATVYRRQTKTLYVQLGDWLTPLLLVLAAVLLIQKRTQKN